jgi:hypothetical protein
LSAPTHPAEGRPLPAPALGGALLISIAAVFGLALWISDVDLGDLFGSLAPDLATADAFGDVDLVAQAGEVAPAEERAPRPISVHLPAIGVASELEELGLTDTGALEVPEDPHLAGWWTGGAGPGERGPAVIVGHVDSHEGPGIFADLGDLGPGDRVVVVREDGTAVHFDVDRIESHPKADFPTEAVYGATDAPELRIITCSGEFDRSARSYEDNLVVFLTLAGWSTT